MPKENRSSGQKVKESDMDGIWKAEKVETDEVLAPADLFGVNNVFLTVDDKKAGLYMDIDSTDGIIDISDLETVFQMELCRLRSAVEIWEKKDEYKDIECDATMLEDGTLRMTLSDASEISFIMEKVPGKTWMQPKSRSKARRINNGRIQNGR